MSAGGRSRAAALALLAGVVVVAGAAIVVPAALSWSKQGAVIRDARLKVLRAEERNTARDKLISTQSSWNAFVVDPKSGFSLAETDAAAIIEAKARVSEAFVSLGGTSTVEAETVDTDRSGVHKIALEVRGSLPRPQLAALLASLESAPPFLIIRRFESSIDAGDTLRISLSASVYRLEERES